MAMGGISTGLSNPLRINHSNPASYAAFEPSSYLFEAGIFSKFVRLKHETLTQSGNFTSLGHFLMGFPVSKTIKSSIGLIPYSNFGYRIVDITTEANVGKISRVYEGGGGINQAYIGSSVGLGKRFSLGVNASYLFGSLEKNRTVGFPDSANHFNTRIINDTRAVGFRVTSGMQYRQPVGKNYALVFGATYSPAIKINTSETTLAYTFFYSTLGIDDIRDTILNTPATKGKIQLPAEISGGVVFHRNDRWMIGADYRWQNWEKFSFTGRSDSFRNSRSFAFGGQYNPDASATSGYMSWVSYRFGLRYSQSFLELRDNQLNEFGISFGLGLPLVRTRTTINLGIEAGSRGTIKANLIRESFFRLSVGFSIYERWFEKRKYF